MYSDAFPIVNTIVKGCEVSGDNFTPVGNDITRARPIRLFPTSRQRKILFDWFEAYRKVYNLGIKYQRQRTFDKLKIIKNHEKLRDVVCDVYRDQIDEISIKYNINKHVIDYAFKDITAAYKSALTNVKRKNFKLPRNKNKKSTKRKIRKNKIRKHKRYKNISVRFKLRYKKAENPRLCMAIPGDTFSTEFNTFAPTVFGNDIKSSSSIKGPKRDSRLTYNKRKDMFLLWVPEYRCQKLSTNRNSWCSLDPGVRVFQTGYDTKNIIEYGVSEAKLIRKYYKRLEELKEFRKRGWYKKFTSRIYEKMTNMVSDLHWKTSLNLVKNNYTILIGNMSTIGCVRRDDSVLDRITKQVCIQLSHYRFKQRLKAKCEEYLSGFEIVDEHYTSMCCGGCSVNNRGLGRAEIFKCPQIDCGFVWMRDANGARNIAMKHFGWFKPIEDN
jgi:transposase